MRSRKQLETERLAKARVAGAMHAEVLGTHPGQVEVSMVLELTHAGLKRRVRVPGWGVKLLVTSYEDVVGLDGAVRAGVRAWLEGCVADGCVRCDSCGAKVPRGK